MTSQFDTDLQARLVDINDHQESAECHRQLTICQTTATPQRLKQVIVSWTKLEKHGERKTDKFHNLLSSLVFEPPNHEVVAIVANH